VRRKGAQCTANFAFFDATDVYIGQAAHCSGTGAATEADGCDAGSLPVGTPVEVTDASRPGAMVSNPWLTMQAAGETNPERELAYLAGHASLAVTPATGPEPFRGPLLPA
jgi:hypothetical protein